MARSHIVVRKASTAPPSAVVQLSGLAAGCIAAGLGTVASSRRVPVGISATASVGAVTTSPAGTFGQDWATRSTQPGVVQAIAFDSPSDVVDHTLADVAAANVYWQSEIKCGGNGALRFNVRNADGANSGNVWIPLRSNNAGFGQGSEYYVQFRYYADEKFWRYKSPNIDVSTLGPKVCTIGAIPQGSPGGVVNGGSHMNNTVVIQNSNYRGFYQLYWYDPGIVVAEAIRNTPCNAFNRSFQNGIDIGTPTSPATCAQYANRYGPIFDYGSGTSAPAFAVNDITTDGHPRAEALGSGVRVSSNNWHTILMRVKIGNWGAANSEVEVWIAGDGESYRLVHRWLNITLGNDVDHAALWLLPYDTGKLANTKGVDTFVCYDEVIVSTAWIAEPPASETLMAQLPTYFRNQAEKTWLADNSTLASIDPEDSPALNPNFPANAPWHGIEGQSAVVNDWCGAVASYSSLDIPRQGGHGGYGGNEYYRKNFLAESPTWVLLEPPSTSVQNNVVFYADGKPSSIHGASDMAFIPAGVTNGNRTVCLGYSTFDSTGNGQKPPDVASFSIDTLNYDARDFFADSPSGSGIEGGDFSSMAYDQVKRRVYRKTRMNISQGGGFVSLDPVTKTWTTHATGTVLTESDNTSAIDTLRHVFVNAQQGVLRAWDLDSPSTAPVTLTTSGAGPGSGAIGFVYDSVSNCFLAWNGGGTVYKLTPPLTSQNWRTSTWVWSTLTNAGGGATPTGVTASGGTFGRFNLIAALRALVVVNDVSQPTYIYKLPRGSV